MLWSWPAASKARSGLSGGSRSMVRDFLTVVYKSTAPLSILVLNLRRAALDSRHANYFTTGGNDARLCDCKSFHDRRAYEHRRTRRRRAPQGVRAHGRRCTGLDRHRNQEGQDRRVVWHEQRGGRRVLQAWRAGAGSRGNQQRPRRLCRRRSDQRRARLGHRCRWCVGRRGRSGLRRRPSGGWGRLMAGSIKQGEEIVSKTILITGAGSGFGEGASIGLAKAGHAIIAGVQIWPQVSELRGKAKALGLANLRVEKFDILDPYDVAVALKWDIDVLFSNAGIGQAGPVCEIPMDLVRRNYETNVFAPLALAQAFIRKFWTRSGRARSSSPPPWAASSPPRAS